MTVTQATATLRQFNRTWSRRVGVLDDSFLGLDLPYGVARLLYEVGAEGGRAAVGELRERLGLDSGYLTRLVRRLSRRDLVVVEPDPHDRRRRVLRLTASGEQTWQELETRSESLAGQLLEPLAEAHRQRLTEALAEADLLIRAATAQLVEVSVTDPLAVTTVGRMFAEISDGFGFDPGERHPSGAAASDASTLGSGRGVFLLALSDGAPVACGGVRRLERRPNTAELKRMWVDPQWRGAGLASRLVGELEQRAVALGCDRMVLDTHGSLTAAIAMYTALGYHRTARFEGADPQSQVWFAKALADTAVPP